MAYNFNTNPYYDDFDESKGFYRILFKPGYAVQARELTQLQTQLQHQITKFGEHIFKDGSIVLGGKTFFYDVNYILVTRNNSISNFNNQNFEGQSTGAKGTVIKTEVVNETTAKIYFRVTNGIQFDKNEVVVCDNLNTETTLNSDTFFGTSVAFSIEDSVFFVNGFFVFCEEQTTIISDNELATCRVGLVVTENIVNSNQDTSLLDPALGSYNYSAPGADRYSISLELFSFAFDPLSFEADENSSEGFIELARFVDGEQVSVTRVPIYSEIENTFARRTFDESGDYTVRPFGLSVINSPTANSELLALRIEPGKAYVKGYEFETISSTLVTLPKSRDTIIEDGFPLFTNYGKYFYVESISGDLDYTGNKTVFLNNGTTLSNSAIGNARVKYIEYDSTDGIKQVYKLYVDSINIFDGVNVSISNVRSLNVSTFRANVALNSYSTSIDVEGNDNSTYIVEIPKNYVKTLLVSGGDTVYSTTKKLNNAEFASNGSVATATVENAIANQNFLGSGILSESDTRNLILVTVATSTNTSFLPVGTILDYDTHSFRVEVVDEENLTLTANSPYAFTATVFAKIAISDAIQKNKTLTSGTLTISGSSLTVANLSSTISLQKSDCTRLVAVVATDNSANEYDYTSSYTLNTGQTDTLYDHGSIQLRPGFVDPITDNVANIQSVTATFDYYAHSSTGGFFSVDSYPSYEGIPPYTSGSGKTFDLRNCLDFRPRRDDNSTNISGTLISEPSSTIFCDFEYYVGRIDRLVLTKERKFSLIKGIPSVNPAVPVDIPDAMSLYIITVPPYTRTPEEVSFAFIENKRYTMRDIGRIERRVERMEFYTALSLLEKQAKDESIPSDVPTIDRFKNGILVDSFAGHSVGDVSNPDYRCSIDYNQRYLRAPFSTYSYTFKFNSGTNHLKRGDLVTLNYTTESFLNQPLFSGVVNLNPYFVFTWNGFLDLNPSSDNWIDTSVRPDVVVNLNGENDVYTTLASTVDNPASTGVRWSDWQTIINGVTQVTNQESTSTAVSTSGFIETTTTTTFNTQTTTVTDKLARVGYEIKTGAVQTVTKDLGSKIVDVSIAPYVRSRLVDYSARALKPLTPLIATFDNQDISNFCYPATEIILSSGNTVNQNAESIALSTNTNNRAKIILRKKDRIFVRETSNGIFSTSNTILWVVNGSTSGTGSAVISGIVRPNGLFTNDLGDVAGTFFIPPATFRTGEKIFKLSDTNTKDSTTAAATKYIAQGLSQSVERTLVSTRVSTVSIDPILETTGTTRTTTETNVVGTTTTVVDRTPEPPPPEPPVVNPTPVPCGSTQTASNENPDFFRKRAGTDKYLYTLAFGSNTGPCGITYSSAGQDSVPVERTVPDRFTIIWDGNEYTTGFVGSPSFNPELNRLGFPSVVGPRTGQLLFNKRKSEPSTATLIVDAPLRGTAWRFSLICPLGASVTPPTPEPPYRFVPKPTYTFAYYPIGLDGEAPINANLCKRDSGKITSSTPYKVRLAVQTGTELNAPRYIRFTSVQAYARLVEKEPGSSPRAPTLHQLNVSSSSFDVNLIPDPNNDRRNTADVFLDITFPDSFIQQMLPYDEYNLEFITLSEVYSDAGRTVLVPAEDLNTTRVGPQASTGDNLGRILFCRSRYNAVTRDPVAQTFFVEPNVYPNGIFLDSVDVFFKKKSSIYPVTLQLRPTVNGYPSSKEIVPFSIVNLEPSDVNISDDASLSTNFRFPSPVYLPPGEHSLVLLCDTTEYEVYTATIGDFVLNNPDLRITSQPNVGSLFKSQNASTWTPFQEEDLMFRLNKCVFNTGVANSASVVLDCDFPAEGEVQFDTFFADGELLDFGATNIDYSQKTTNLSDVKDANFTNYQLGSNYTLPSRRKIRSGQPSDLQMNLVMTTEDRNITPVVDLARFSTVLIRNVINNGELSNSNFLISNYGEGYTGNANVVITSNTGSGAAATARYIGGNTGRLEIVVTNPGSGYTGLVTATIKRDGTATANAKVIVQNEVGTQGGNALARYITRKVRLAPGFESTDLKAYLLANVPTGTSIKVYYKVAPETSVFFELEPWREMELESAGEFTETGFADYKYKTPGDTALPSGDRFNTFAIKIVMLSSNPVKVPIIRDLRVIALDD